MVRWLILPCAWAFNILRLRQNGWHFVDDILEVIFLNVNFSKPIKISLTFDPESPIDNKVSIGSDNGLSPDRQQAIVRTNDGHDYQCIYTSLSFNGLQMALNGKW